MDRILREFQEFYRAYIDNIVIFSATLEKHVEHLKAVFKRFQDLNISINPNKSFIGYSLVTLLGQEVNGLGFLTAKDKVQALQNIQFP